MARAGVPFRSSRFKLEFGQPFESLEDAAAFFRVYGGEGPLTREDVRGALIEDPTGRYPYYLPFEKHIGMVSVLAEDIPPCGIGLPTESAI